MPDLILINPTAAREHPFHVLFNDFRQAGEAEWCDQNALAFSDFPAYVERLQAEAHSVTVPGWSPTSHFWLIDGDSIIGTLRLRHHLTPLVEERAGHIGYDIAPSFRRRGHGTEMLRLALREAAKLNLGDLTAICADSNEASRKIIQKHGGIAQKNHNSETWYRIPGAKLHSRGMKSS